MKTLVIFLAVGMFLLSGCGGRNPEDSQPRAKFYSDVNALADAMNKSGRSCSDVLPIEVTPGGTVVAQGVCQDSTVLTIYATPEDKNLDVSNNLEGYVQDDHSNQILYGSNWSILGPHLHPLQDQIGGIWYHH